jgi:membrane-bound serine protease (ClpP class)
VNPIPILLLVGSLALLAIEVIIVSFGLISLIAVACGVGSVVLAFRESAVYGWSMVGLLIVGAPAVLRGAFILLPKLPFARGFYLRAPKLTQEDRHAADQTDPALVGLLGKSVTPLRPAGTAILRNAPHDVIAADGKMIESGVTIKVVDVSGNRIVVERAELDTPPESNG